MERFLIRLSTEADFAGLKTIKKSADETLNRFYHLKPGVIREEKNPQTAVIVAEVAGQLVGRCEYSVFEGRLHFFSVGVLASHRQNGVLRAMFRFLENTARQKKCRSIHCATIALTDNAQIFERLGMTVESRHESAFFISPEGAPVDEIRLSRQL
jgi:N-acetylglutamate synthase-like GNAT family acetyltransferase